MDQPGASIRFGFNLGLKNADGVPVEGDFEVDDGGLPSCTTSAG